MALAPQQSPRPAPVSRPPTLLPTPKRDDAARRISGEILGGIFGAVPPAQLAVRFWDGALWRAAPPDVAVTLVLNAPSALRRMFLPPTERTAATAYIRGDFDLTGDLEAATGLIEPIQRAFRSPTMVLRLMRLLRQLPEGTDDARELAVRPARLHGRRHSQRRDREAIQYHYNVSNDFYRLWLDSRMVYSCAYFKDGLAGVDDDLDQAQEAKLDLVCRKLRLRPGERFLDIGCGWGSLVLFAAERYGVQATGVTLSEEQARLARERVAAAGLAGQVTILHDDYRNLPASARFDKIASVGMVEHVGRDHLPEYFTTAYRLLRPRGLFLNHAIAQQHGFSTRVRRLTERLLANQTSFMLRYIFPDGELVPISEMLSYAEHAGWEVRDVESLREHYARTLRLWRQRLEARHEEARRIVSEQKYRVWRLYLAGTAYSFARENSSIYQSLLAKPDRAGRVDLPATRADLYA